MCTGVPLSTKGDTQVYTPPTRPVPSYSNYLMPVFLQFQGRAMRLSPVQAGRKDGKAHIYLRHGNSTLSLSGCPSSLTSTLSRYQPLPEPLPSCLILTRLTFLIVTHSMVNSSAFRGEKRQQNHVDDGSLETQHQVGTHSRRQKAALRG